MSRQPVRLFRAAIPGRSGSWAFQPLLVAPWLFVLATMIYGCVSSAPAETEQVAGSPVAKALEPPCDGASDEARQFRIRYGLRADDCWIQAVAADPAAQEAVGEFGVPLMPSERFDLQNRHTDFDLVREIDAYGALFPNSYAGAYMDQRASQAFIAMFKDEAPRHQAALSNLLPQARIEVRDVDWSTPDLNTFLKLVEAEQAWFATIGVQYLTADRSITEDFVSVDYLGPVAAEELIEAHFGNPTWLDVERQGPLPWTGPRGNLVIDVVDQNGRPVPGLWCQFVAEDPEAASPGEDIFGTDDSGRCSLANLPAVAYRITLHRFVENDHYEHIKEFRVVLSPGGTTTSVAVEMP